MTTTETEEASRRAGGHSPEQVDVAEAVEVVAVVVIVVVVVTVV